MNLIKREYSPFSKDLNQLFDNFLRIQSDPSYVDTGTWAPMVDIKEEKDKFIVTADIPGVDQKDIHVSPENNILTIQGERQMEKSEQKDNYSRIERVQGQFYRRFNLPQSVDDAKIDATYKHGVLKICIPKKEPVKGKRIEVRSQD